MSLLPKQKRYLKSLAHHLQPTVRVGKGGVTPKLVEETKRTLEAHELIKVKIEVDDSDDRKKLAAELAGGSEAEVVGSVGKIAMLYRQRAEKPKIKLPKPSAPEEPDVDSDQD